MKEKFEKEEPGKVIDMNEWLEKKGRQRRREQAYMQKEMPNADEEKLREWLQNLQDTKERTEKKFDDAITKHGRESPLVVGLEEELRRINGFIQETEDISVKLKDAKEAYGRVAQSEKDKERGK